MANYVELKAAIAQVIKTNGNEEITGQALQDVLNTIINTVGYGSSYMGVANPTTDPGLPPDSNVFYLAFEPGIYTNFENLTVRRGLTVLWNNQYGWQLTNVFIDYNNPYIYDGKLGMPGNGSEYGVLEVLKSIQLIGDWDINKHYFVEQISRNATNYGYRLIISSIDENNIQKIEYDTGNGYQLEEAENRTTICIFPEINGKSVIAGIDYYLMDDNSFYDTHTTNNFLLRQSVIVPKQRSDLYFRYFQGAMSAVENIVMNAIKNIFLVGDWDISKHYIIDEINRNHTDSNYRFSIREVDESGVSLEISYDTGVNFSVVEAGAGKYTTVIFPIYKNRYVVAIIDYNILQNNGRFVIYPYNRYILNNNILFPQILESIDTSCMYDAKLGLVENTTSRSIVSAIKDIQLYGKWDMTKRYKIDTLSRDDSGYKYRLVIEDLDGNEIYDTGVNFSVVEAGAGKYTTVDFGVNALGLGVRATIDYNIIPNNAQNVIGGVSNAVFRSSVFKNDDTSDTYIGGEIGEVIQQYSKSDLIPAFDLQDRFRQIIMGATSKKGFICMRSDDTPRVDLEWIKLLDTHGLKYTICANVPYFDVNNTRELMQKIQQSGHEVCDHTCFHTTFYANVPDEYMKFFQPYIDSGDITRTQEENLGGIKGKRITFKTKVLENYQEHQIGTNNGYALTAGTSRITGDFSVAPSGDNLLLYIDNTIGDKIGWVMGVNRDDTGITMTNNDGTTPIPTGSEYINMYAVVPTVFNYTLTEDATYCLLLSGQCWFNKLGLRKPMVWNQPGGTMPFVDRTYLSRVIKRLGMRGGETDQTLSEGAKATYNYYTPFPFVTYNWEGGYLHFDACDGSDAWMNNVKGMIADYVATRNIRTLATHFIYNNFPGATTDEKRQNWLIWFDKLFKWLNEANIEMLTLEERDFVLDYSETNRYANVFPELYYDRANRGKPDGYTITNTNVLYTDNGRPESKNKALELYGTGNVFKINNLGGLEKGKMLLRGFLQSSTSAAKVTISTSQGLTIPSWNQLPYTPTLDEITFNNYNQWREFEIELDIPYTMNYINISLDVENVPTEKVFVSGITLIGK